MSNITDNISYTALLQHKKGNGHRFNAQYEQNNFYTKIFNKKQDLSVSLIANKSVNGQPGFYIEERPSLTSIGFPIEIQFIYNCLKNKLGC